MKKTFLAKRNALLSSRNISWGFLALCFVFLALLLRLIAPDFFLRVATPLFHISDTIALQSHSLFSVFDNVSVVVTRNESLVRENVALSIENQTLLKKIENLTKLLNAEDSSKGSAGILAPVVARPPVVPYDTLLVAAGTDDGIEVGVEAFGDGGSPIGIVSSVLAHFSRITLFSASGVTTEGWIGHDALAITLTGAGGGALQTSVARDAGVVVGDPVFVSGPGMLPIGSVSRIDSDPSSPGVVVHIASAVNLFSLGLVALRATGIVPMTLATSTTP